MSGADDGAGTSVKILCFDRDLTLTLDDGTIVPLPAGRASAVDGDLVFDPGAAHIVLQETYEQVCRDCRNNGIPMPRELPLEVMGRLPGAPEDLRDVFSTGECPEEVRACLINGAAGGIGDGIMAAPALEVMMERLREIGAVEVAFDVYSAFPARTAAALRGITGLRVKAVPFSLKQFQGYSHYLDMSSVLLDPDFGRLHMTDFFLRKAGLDPTAVTARDKEPFLRLGAPSWAGGITLACEQRRRETGCRNLCALIFHCTGTRSMPESLAARLAKALAEAGWHPVVLMEDRERAAAFVHGHGLTGVVWDASFLSTSHECYFHLLKEMDAIVSVDTSAVHIGAALRKPVAAIFNSIDAGLRCRYSPTVAPVQIPYRGRTCVAPCGTSKSKAYVKGKMDHGARFHLEFGFSCEEAVDRKAVLDEMVSRIHALPPGPAFSAGLDELRREYGRRLSAPHAPCWDGLDIGQVLAALDHAVELSSSAGRVSRCPACGREERHERIDRRRNMERLLCSVCGTSFWEGFGEAGAQAFFPAPSPREAKTLADLVPPGEGRVLCVSEGDAGTASAWCASLERPVDYSDMPRFPDEAGGAPVVLFLGALDTAANPHDLLRRALEFGDGLVVVAARAREWLDLGHGGEEMATAWTKDALARLCRRAGGRCLAIRPTPPPWEAVRPERGAFPLTARTETGGMATLGWRDIETYVRTHIEPGLAKTGGVGRFWIMAAG